MSSTTAQKAARHLANVSPSEVDAMTACDPEMLAGLVTIVRTITGDEDVTEHATIIVASLLPGAQSPMHAARAAVRIARRAVAASKALRAEDMYGDLTEEVVTSWQEAGAHHSLTRYAPDPATRYAPTFGDLVATVCAMVGDSDLTDAARAYVTHARTCTRCAATDSHRVTLPGIRAHVEGRGADDASYHSERRAVLRALARVGTFSGLTDRIGDPAPLAPAHAPHGRVSLGNIRKDSTRDQVAPVRTVWESCRYSDWTGEARAMTGVETEALHVVREREARYDGESYDGGTHAPMSAQADTFGHAPHAEANTGSATTPGQALPSGAIPVSPRKRARTGSTGPTVPVW